MGNTVSLLPVISRRFAGFSYFLFFIDLFFCCSALYFFQQTLVCEKFHKVNF